MGIEKPYNKGLTTWNTCVNERETGGKLNMRGEELVKVEDFKYLG